MASNDLFLRSDATKGETSVDNDLRLRADADKGAAAADWYPRIRRRRRSWWIFLVASASALGYGVA